MYDIFPSESTEYLHHRTDDGGSMVHGWRVTAF